MEESNEVCCLKYLIYRVMKSSGQDMEKRKSTASLVTQISWSVNFRGRDIYGRMMLEQILW